MRNTGTIWLKTMTTQLKISIVIKITLTLFRHAKKYTKQLLEHKKLCANAFAVPSIVYVSILNNLLIFYSLYIIK